ncbi:MAG: hypothetical protein QM754_18520 [Tepidisphaeraceae bacterium]
MAQLTADISRKYKLNPDVRGELPVAASTTIFMGAAVGKSSGYARQLVAADAFCGFAAGGPTVNVANAERPGLTGNGGIAIGSAGGLTVELRTEGIIEVPVASVAGLSDTTSTGVSVYMSDSNTFTLTSTSNTKIGTVDWVLNGIVGIYFKADQTKVS